MRLPQSWVAVSASAWKCVRTSKKATIRLMPKAPPSWRMKLAMPAPWRTLSAGSGLQRGGVEAGIDEAEAEPRDHHHADQGPEGRVDVGHVHIKAKPVANSSRPTMIMVEAGMASAMPPGDREDEGEHDAGRHHHQPGQQRREADDGLHEHRDDVGRAHHAGAEDEGDHRRGGELDVGEDADVDHRARRVQLPQDEGDGRPGAPTVSRRTMVSEVQPSRWPSAMPVISPSSAVHSSAKPSQSNGGICLGIGRRRHEQQARARRRARRTAAR